MKIENEELKAKIKESILKIKQFTDRIGELETKNNELTRENGELKTKISEIAHENDQLKTQFKESMVCDAQFRLYKYCDSLPFDPRSQHERMKFVLAL